MPIRTERLGGGGGEGRVGCYCTCYDYPLVFCDVCVCVRVWQSISGRYAPGEETSGQSSRLFQRELFLYVLTPSSLIRRAWRSLPYRTLHGMACERMGVSMRSCNEARHSCEFSTPTRGGTPVRGRFVGCTSRVPLFFAWSNFDRAILQHANWKHGHDYPGDCL